MRQPPRPGATMITPDLSIVVVHWNVPGLLDACLRSIAAERERATSLTCETLVVDCASPADGHRAVVAGHSDVALIEMSENRGYAAGCNAGIAASRGDAVLLLNPDVELEPESLVALVRGLETASHIGMTAPLLLNPDGSQQSAGYRFPGPSSLLFDLLPVPARLIESPLNGRAPTGDGVQPIRIDYPLGAAMCVRRAAADAAGPLDEGYGMYSEEIDWARRLAERGWTTLLIPTARVVHHGGQSTAQRPDAMREALWMSRARYGRRWWSARQRRIASLAVALGTRLDDRRAGGDRRAMNAGIRRAFRDAAGQQ